MPVEVYWSKYARDSLLEIYVKIGLANPAAAESFFDRIEEKVARLASHPRMGPRRPDIGPTSRALVASPYLILYETHPDADDLAPSKVEIVAILDGRRDLSNLADRS